MEAPSYHRQYLRTCQWPQPPPSEFLDPKPIFAFETPHPWPVPHLGYLLLPLLLLSCSSATCWVLPPHPTLPLLLSSAPSRPSPSRGCNIRFTIWGLSCYNNRRRLCCEEQLAPCAASRAASILQPGRRPSLLPPKPSHPLPGVCVYADGCPGRLGQGECDMRLPFQGCPCEFGG